MITAQLKVTLYHTYPTGEKIAWGFVYNDTKQRFDDGTRIHTSVIVNEDDKYIHTLNSVYEKI